MRGARISTASKTASVIRLAGHRSWVVGTSISRRGLVVSCLTPHTKIIGLLFRQLHGHKRWVLTRCAFANLQHPELHFADVDGLTLLHADVMLNPHALPRHTDPESHAKSVFGFTFV